MNDITLVLTSCNRVDLLDRTLESIGSEVLQSLGHRIIIDDSGDDSVKDYFSKYDSSWQIILNEENIGQPKSVDKAYSFVTTPYVFHCEDDWFFEKPLNLEACVDILESDETLLQVTARSGDPHPKVGDALLSNKGFGYVNKLEGWRDTWWGFTYNPSVFRMEAYKKLGQYSGMNEQTISKKYNDLGYKTVCLLEDCYYHIGDNRTTCSYKKL